MFQFPWSSLIHLWIQCMMLRVCLSGFPHSDIPGSTSICDYPRLFGAYPVLLRLLVPRHSPYALISLTRNIIYCEIFNVQSLNGGDEEIRTPDPLLARQVLSQLSYTPTKYITKQCEYFIDRSFATQICLLPFGRANLVLIASDLHQFTFVHCVRSRTP
jgi:hypothetical protein